MKRCTEMQFCFAVVVILGLWQLEIAHGCLSGRYGRYENWPTNSDWDELLMLLTGKFGNNGWGWKSTNSYAYSSQGDYPFGTLKYSSGNPWGTSGSDSSGGSLLSHSSSSTSSSSSSKLRTEKIKEALNSYFRSKPTTTNNGWSADSGGGGGGFVGESFIDTPRPGPPYDDSPGPGPPYPATAPESGGPSPIGLGRWPGGGFNEPNNEISHNSYPEDHQHSSWPLPQGPPSRDEGPSYPQNIANFHGSNGGGGLGNDNQFQTDSDVFGSYDGNKRRRHGRRRSHSNYQERVPFSKQKQPTHKRQRNPQAGLPTRPHKTSRSSPYIPRRRGGRYSRRQSRMGLPLAIRRRKLDTSFGGYKVDHSKLRWLDRNKGDLLNE